MVFEYLFSLRCWFWLISCSSVTSSCKCGDTIFILGLCLKEEDEKRVHGPLVCVRCRSLMHQAFWNKSHSVLVLCVHDRNHLFCHFDQDLSSNGINERHLKNFIQTGNVNLLHSWSSNDGSLFLAKSSLPYSRQYFLTMVVFVWIWLGVWVDHSLLISMKFIHYSQVCRCWHNKCDHETYQSFCNVSGDSGLLWKSEKSGGVISIGNKACDVWSCDSHRGLRWHGGLKGCVYNGRSERCLDFEILVNVYRWYMGQNVFNTSFLFGSDKPTPYTERIARTKTFFEACSANLVFRSSSGFRWGRQTQNAQVKIKFRTLNFPVPKLERGYWLYQQVYFWVRCQNW